VAGSAAPGEVLVSSTVRDLVTGSGLRFMDRGTHNLHDVPGSGASSRWRAERADPRIEFHGRFTSRGAQARTARRDQLPGGVRCAKKADLG